MAGKRTAREQHATQPAAAQATVDAEPPAAAPEPEQTAAEQLHDQEVEEIEVLADDANAVDALVIWAASKQDFNPLPPQPNVVLHFFRIRVRKSG